ncbi:VOC family protein [Nocardia vinacea]|uniref:VOC family protein n=1 Tax=Nocardia vinacea TaxID=96468 RepID=UPI00341C4A4A
MHLQLIGRGRWAPSALIRRTDRPSSLPPGVWLDLGGQQVHLLPAEPPEARGQHLAILVDELDATIVQLRADGVEVTDPILIGTSRQSLLVDPSGNQLELHETGR